MPSVSQKLPAGQIAVKIPGPMLQSKLTMLILKNLSLEQQKLAAGTATQRPGASLLALCSSVNGTLAFLFLQIAHEACNIR